MNIRVLENNFMIFLFVFSGFLTSSCASTGTVELTETKNGCFKTVPTPVLQAHNIDVEIAKTILSDISLGNIKAAYKPTFTRLLSENSLSQWVNQVMDCQAGQNLESTEYKLWYFSMKEVSTKASPQELIQWLEKNPPSSFHNKAKKIEDEKRKKEEDRIKTKVETEFDREIFEINGVSGTIEIPQQAKKVYIKKIGRVEPLLFGLLPK